MNQRPSAYPTIEAATDAAMPIARRDRRRLCIIADQPHDGGFAIADHSCADQEHVYINVNEDGKTGEGPAAHSLPIDFTGALPH